MNFVRESNKIEGITRAVTPRELEAHRVLLSASSLAGSDMTRFVHETTGAPMREFPGMNVRVGNHVPIAGGVKVQSGLAQLLMYINGATHEEAPTPYVAHCLYEKLHPFMDGNGRSGRALWLWMMERDTDRAEISRHRKLGFLHTFYYQALEHFRDPMGG